MLSSTVSKLASSSRVLMAQTRGIGQHKLPKWVLLYYILHLTYSLINLRYDAAASIPMKYGMVYMGIVFAFSGLGELFRNLYPLLTFDGSVFMTNPYNHTNIHETYEKKWKNQ